MNLLKEDLDAAVKADGGKPWEAAEAEVLNFPSPSDADLAKGEHDRAIALVVKTIDELAGERHRSQASLVQTMSAAHSAYHRSQGKLNADFDTFSRRLKDLRVLYAVHERHTELAPRLATALRRMVLEGGDPAAWTGKLEAAWAGARHADDQRLWVAFLAGGSEPDATALAAAIDDTRLALPVRAAALEALARPAPEKALAKARTLLTPSREAWHLTDAALRLVRTHGSAEDAPRLGPLAESGPGWLGVEARALRAKLGGGAPPAEVSLFGIPLGTGSVLFLIDGDGDMVPHLPSAAAEVAKAVDALPDSARVAVWVAGRGIARPIDEPVLLAPPERIRVRRTLEKVGKETPRDAGLPDFFVALERLVHEQRESPEPPRIDTVVLVTTSVLYQDENLETRYARWARRAGLRLHAVCYENGRTGFDEYRRLAETTGGRLVLRPKSDD